VETTTLRAIELGSPAMDVPGCPIFDAGSLAASRDMSITRRHELLANYRQAIVTAIGDVGRLLRLQAAVYTVRAGGGWERGR
jgi:hypothetical protein